MRHYPITTIVKISKDSLSGVRQIVSEEQVERNRRP
jgi:hypothetical protein